MLDEVQGISFSVKGKKGERKGKYLQSKIKGCSVGGKYSTV